EYDMFVTAHEFGHQFGAPHTFNANCQANGTSQRLTEGAYEPGSGSTIMSYAAVCSSTSERLQFFRDPFFHSTSLECINSYLDSSNHCWTETFTGNAPPAVSAGA